MALYELSGKRTIVKLNKRTGVAVNVGIEEFLEFVGSGAKRRENALATLIEGGKFQDLTHMYYIVLA